MKTTLVYFIFALSLLAMSNIKAQVPPAQAPSDLHPYVEIFDGNGGYGRLSAGIDMRYVAVRDVWPAKGYYLYRKNGGEWFVLDSSIEGVNLFLTKAVESADVKSFLDQYLLKLLVAAMTIRQSYVIDDQFMSLYRGFEVDGDLRETIEKLRPLVYKQKPTFIGDKWQAWANIATPRGGVERWEVEGTLSPFQIITIKRVLVHPSGWFEVLDQIS
jgi:hypothetical protein